MIRFLPSSFCLFPFPPLSPAHRQQWAYALIFITPAFWGVNYLVARAATNSIAPHMLAFWRWALAGVLMAMVSWREIAAHRDAIRREARQLLVLGALGMWICGAFVYLGGRTTVATNIGLIYALSPVLIAVFSAVALKERIGGVQVAGTALALAGFFHIVLKGQWADLSSVQLTPGDWWIFASAFAFSVSNWAKDQMPTSKATARTICCSSLGSLFHASLLIASSVTGPGSCQPGW